MNRHLPLLFAVIVSTLSAKAEEEAPNVRLLEWDRGLAVQSLTQKQMVVYLWFYEWNMFDAIEPGQHTRGTYMPDRSLSKHDSRDVRH